MFVELTRPVHELPVGYVSQTEPYALDLEKVTLLDSMGCDARGLGGGYNAYRNGVRFIDETEYRHKRVMNDLTQEQKRVRRNIQAKLRREAVARHPGLGGTGVTG